MHIVDADTFTREFCAGQGINLAPAQAYPEQPIAQAIAAKSKPSGECCWCAQGWVTDASTCDWQLDVQLPSPCMPSLPLPIRHRCRKIGTFHPGGACHAAGLSRADPDSPSKYAEALLGREFNSKSLQQFLQHGGEVLRFWMAWDDRAAQYGDRHLLKLHYFVADSTVGATRGGCAALARCPPPPTPAARALLILALAAVSASKCHKQTAPSQPARLPPWPPPDVNRPR